MTERHFSLQQAISLEADSQMHLVSSILIKTMSLTVYTRLPGDGLPEVSEH